MQDKFIVKTTVLTPVAGILRYRGETTGVRCVLAECADLAPCAEIESGAPDNRSCTRSSRAIPATRSPSMRS